MRTSRGVFVTFASVLAAMGLHCGAAHAGLLGPTTIEPDTKFQHWSYVSIINGPGAGAALTVTTPNWTWSIAELAADADGIVNDIMVYNGRHLVGPDPGENPNGPWLSNDGVNPSLVMKNVKPTGGAPGVAGGVFAGGTDFGTHGPLALGAAMHKDRMIVSAIAMSPTGTWQVGSAWTETRVQVKLEHVSADVPAPGALALLGLAGLVGRRRR